jgi:Tfp pilus assembly protein PilO
MIKRWLGIDGVDFVIQAAITVALATLFAAFSRSNEEVAVSAVFTGSLFVLAYRRHWARKRGELGVTSKASDEYVAELEQRVADLEAAQQRVYELEERVDFTERLLARQRDSESLPEGRINAT